jgi:hypothetical protein
MKYFLLLSIFTLKLFASSNDNSLLNQAGDAMIKGLALIISPFVDELYWIVNDCIPTLEYTSTQQISFYVLPNYQTPSALFSYEDDQKFYRLMIVDNDGEKEIIEGAQKSYEHGYYKDYTKLPVGTVLTTTGEILDSDLSPFASRYIRVRGIVDNKIVWLSMSDLQEFSSNDGNASSHNYINNTILNISDNEFIGKNWQCLNK